MRRELIFAGLAGGTVFGLIEAFRAGPLGGLFLGIFFGIGLSYLLHRFESSPAIRKQIDMPDEVRLPGEKVVLSLPANLVVDPRKFGLSRFAFGGLLWAVGLKDRESLGGAAHVTNYRIFFRAHRYNRLRGSISVFLPTVRECTDRSVLIFRKLQVTTVTSALTFVVSRPDDLAVVIESCRDSIGEFTLTALKSHVSQHPSRCCDDLQIWKPLEKWNQFFLLGRGAGEAVVGVATPFAAIGQIFIKELFDLTLVDAWQAFLRGEDSDRGDVADSNVDRGRSEPGDARAA